MVWAGIWLKESFFNKEPSVSVCLNGKENKEMKALLAESEMMLKRIVNESNRLINRRKLKSNVTVVKRARKQIT